MVSRLRIVVVGAGLAGTWLTRALRARGHQVVVVSDTETPGSEAAIALLRSTYLAADERTLLAPALAAWEMLGHEILYGARSTRKGSDKDRFEEDWFAVHPMLPSLDESEFHRAHARPLSPTMVWADREEVEGDAVVWCDARGGMPNASDNAGKVTYGCTWIHEDPDVLADELRVHQWAPYRVIAAARYSDHARLGSSSAGSLPKALEQADRILQEAIDAGIIDGPDGWYRVDGARLRRPELLTYSKDFGWRWAGFHKNGYALAPALADDVARRIEEETA